MSSSTKRIFLGNYELEYANKAETESDSKTDTIKTFSGNITDGDDKPSWKVTFDVVRYAGTVADFIELRKQINRMAKTGDTIKIVEESSLPGETLKTEEIYYGSVTDSRKVTYDVETRTIENFGFVAADKREWVNGEEVSV